MSIDTTPTPPDGILEPEVDAGPHGSLATLEAAVDRLEARGVALERRVAAKTRALWSAYIAGGVVLIVVVAAAYVVSLNNRAAIQANNLRLCAFIGVSIPSRDGAQPTTERGREVAREAAKVYREFRCPGDPTQATPRPDATGTPTSSATKTPTPAPASGTPSTTTSGERP